MCAIRFLPFAVVLLGCPNFRATALPPVNEPIAIDATVFRPFADASVIFDASIVDTTVMPRLDASITTDVSVDGARADRAIDDAGSLTVSRLDLLLVIDNSASMAAAQRRLRNELPSVVTALMTGDLEGQGRTDRDFHHVQSLQVGVVTSDMGTGTDACTSQSLGSNGQIPNVFAFPSDSSTLAAEVGTTGCVVERPLDAMLRALAPATSQSWTAPGYVPVRIAGTAGEMLFGLAGVGAANAGFVRDQAALAVLLMTDDDDSSLHPSTNATEYFSASGAIPIATRAALDAVANDPRVRAPSEIAAAFASLHAQPAHLIFGAIVGLPIQASYDDLTQIANDPRMAPNLHVRGATTCPAAANGRCTPCTLALAERCTNRTELAELTPVCASQAQGVSPNDANALAAPGQRIVQTAQQLRARGVRATLGNICAVDNTTYLRSFVVNIGRILGP